MRSRIEAGQATWFVEFLEKADAAVQSEDRVLAARKKSPLDASVALNAGLWYAAHGRPAEALPHFDAAVAADKSDERLVAREAA